MQVLKVLDVGSSETSTLELQVKAPIILEVFPVTKEMGDDMESLLQPDSYFDIVHCRNALDHTKDAFAAVREMQRVCKPGGTVFIKCWLDQKDTGGKHYWNAKLDGTLDNGTTSFNLEDCGFTIKAIKNGGLSRYDWIEATYDKR